MIKPGLYIARVLRVDLKAGVHTCIWTENSISFQRGKDRFTMTVDRLSPKSRPVEASLIVQNNRGLVLFNVLEG